jgi:hypothetical protein
MRHLTPEQAETHLRLGKALEQWLGRVTATEGAVLRWVRVDRSAEGEYVVALYEAVESERAHQDIYGLYARERDEDGDPQQVFGAPKKVTYDSPTAAMGGVTELGGAADRFVNDGFVQQEYLAATGV